MNTKDIGLFIVRLLFRTAFLAVPAWFIGCVMRGAVALFVSYRLAEMLPDSLIATAAMGYAAILCACLLLRDSKKPTLTTKHEVPKSTPMLPAWSSAPDSSQPFRSNPSVWKDARHKKLVNLLEQHLPEQQASSPRDQSKLPCTGLSARFKRVQMRRTLLAVGFAVLLSMILAPHGDKRGVEGWGPFFSTSGFNIQSGRIWNVGRVMIDMLALEMIFLAVLFAVIANTHWRRVIASKRVLCVVTTCTAIALIGLSVFALPHSAERAKADEENAEAVLRSSHDYYYASAKLRAAALNWRFALRFGEAKRVEQRANILAADGAEDAKRKEKLEKRLAQAREFDRQWQVNAEKFIAFHPELRNENSLYSLAMKKILNSNPLYSQRVDGYELAYKVIKKQLPSPGELLPTTEFYRLLENLKTDVAPAMPVAEQQNP